MELAWQGLGYIRICSDMLVALPLRMLDMIRAASKRIWVIGISSTQSDIPSCRRSGSKSSGKTEIERTGKVSPLGGGKPPVLYYPNRRPQRSQWSRRSK